MGLTDTIGKVRRRAGMRPPVRYRSIADGYIREEPGHPGRTGLGIAFSGGGVRSAIFNLGVLQELQRQDKLREADHLAAVSGGCYIAGAYWITAAESVSGVFEEMAPWAPGSPEEQRFRQEMDYLARGPRGWVWMALNLVYGTLLNYLPLMVAAGVVGRLLGWAYVDLELAPSLSADLTDVHPLVSTRLIVAFATMLLLLGLSAVGWRRLAERATSHHGKTQRAETVVTFSFVILTVVVSLGLLGPAAITLYRRFLRAVLGERAALMTSGALVSRIAGALVFMAILLVIAALAAALARVRFLAFFAQVVSSLAGVGLLVLPAVAGAEASSRNGLNDPGDVIETILMLLLLVVLGVWIHNGRYSLHLFYKERLQHAFAVKRLGNNRPAEAIQFTTPIMLTDVCSKIRHRDDIDLPNLIVCASVTLRDRRLLPRGRWADSFAFTEDDCGGPTIGFRRMHEYQENSGKVELTLPALMAISGAAFSPTMGRFTKWQHTFTLAMLNVRLGVWIPNPTHGYAKVLPALRETMETETSWHRRHWAGLKMGWYEPGALYVFREARGWGRSDARFIHVGDGGHLDNLGLIELLRRRCTRIVCFDASGKRDPLLGELGVAIALARSELGVRIEFAEAEIEMLRRPERERPAIRGTVVYPDGTAGVLIVARACLSKRAPLDVQTFADRDRRFPHHGLQSQVYAEDRFEAYRALGEHAAREALSLLDAPTWP